MTLICRKTVQLSQQTQTENSEILVLPKKSPYICIVERRESLFATFTKLERHEHRQREITNEERDAGILRPAPAAPATFLRQ